MTTLRGIVIVAGVLTAAIVLNGCNYRKSKGDGTVEKFPYAEIIPPPELLGKVMYKDVQRDFFGKYCTFCHTNFETYDGIASELDAIRVAVFIANSMPRGPNKPGKKDLEALAAWIESGAPEAGPDDVKAPGI